MRTNLLACPHCDLLQRTVPVRDTAVARCGRCRLELYRPYDENLDRPLAFTLAAGILFVFANVFPIVGLELSGVRTTATLTGTAMALSDQHMKFLAAVVFFTTVIVPAVQLTAMTYVLVPLRLGAAPRYMPLALRALQAVRPWGMVEVFLLGMFVSLVKLAGMATVIPGPGLWSFGALLLAIAGAVATFDARAAWAQQAVAR